MRILIFSILMALIVTACENNLEINYPQFGIVSHIQNAPKLSESKLRMIDGIYNSSEPSKRLGDYFVLKSHKDKITVFCRQSIDFIVLDAGILDSGIVFEGYGRDIETTETILVRLFISNSNGALDLIEGKTKPTNLEFKITVFDNLENKSKPQESIYKFYNEISDDKEFMIIAHRGGGRNSDLLPASENSIEMIKYSGYMGANAIEIDIRLSKDKIPLLFHDDFISNRLVREDLLVGRIENYTIAQLKAFCTLKYGEKIPTLREALDEIIKNTDLKMVWLDIKTPSVAEYVIPIILEYNKIIKNENRDLQLVFGITSEQVEKQFISHPDHSQIESLSELSHLEIDKNKSKIWAPQWTLGYQNSIIGELKGRGIRSYVWTIDNRTFIRDFIKESNFDGMLSNYAPIVTYEYYAKGLK